MGKTGLVLGVLLLCASVFFWGAGLMALLGLRWVDGLMWMTASGTAVAAGVFGVRSV